MNPKNHTYTQPLTISIQTIGIDKKNCKSKHLIQLFAHFLIVTLRNKLG